MAAAAAFDWERALREDARVGELQRLVALVLTRNFPGEAEKYAPRAIPAPKARVAPPKTVEPTPTPARKQTEPDFIDPEEYLSEASSAVEGREVDPMDELSDFEPPGVRVSGASAGQRRPRDEEEMSDAEIPAAAGSTASRRRVVDEEDEGDVDMGYEAPNVEQEDAEMEEDEEPTVCAVCATSANEAQILICDGCEDEYHTYCLQPPLTGVPEGDWFCPKCAAKQQQSAPSVAVKQEAAIKTSLGMSQSNSQPPTTVAQDAETAQSSAPSALGGSASTLPANGIPSTENQQSFGTTGNGNAPSTATSVSIAHTLEADPARSNSLLVHACNCETTRCVSAEFQELCPHMKRFLRSACWASHNEAWRSSRLARVTVELFATHAMSCELPQCNVPLCEKIRSEEFV